MTAGLPAGRECIDRIDGGVAERTLVAVADYLGIETEEVG
jgi:hypothetical protein